MKGKPGSQEESRHHIMRSVWLENCLWCVDHWTYPAELLEFSGAATVVTGLWLFLLPPEVLSRAGDLTGKAEIPSSGWVTCLCLSCQGFMRTWIWPFQFQKKGFTRPSKVSDCLTHRRTISMQINQKASNIYLTVCLLLILIPASIVTLIFGHIEASIICFPN